MELLVLLLFLALPVLPVRGGSLVPPRRSLHLELARVDAAAAANLTDHELILRAVQRSLDRPGIVARSGGSRGRGAQGRRERGPAGARWRRVPGQARDRHAAALLLGGHRHGQRPRLVAVPALRQLLPPGRPDLQPQALLLLRRRAMKQRHLRTAGRPQVPTCTQRCTAPSLITTYIQPRDAANVLTRKCMCICDEYTYKYSGNAVTKGTLAIDKLAVGGDVFHAVVLGCSDSSVGGPPAQASGLVGLGRGPLSLVSQLSVRRFMYCLPPPMSRTPVKLVLGARADAVRNVSDRVTVTIVQHAVPVLLLPQLRRAGRGRPDPGRPGTIRRPTSPPTCGGGGGSGSGGSANAYGMIVDVASTISFLEASLYDELADDLEEEIRLPRATPSLRLGLELCFILPEGVGIDRVYVPTVSMSFDGRWLELDRDRLFVEDGRMMCLMIGRTSGVSILGNFQQQNMHVLYNLRRGKITFAKPSCDSLP
ncbi:unnamed protein product [Miscanthus lutarioriparius]|uniref:Peptidase A1 domain-containing protein n=1 Tax=Miscanthus lutarioriparius TaxID=422564 RepID=A0A811QUX8_9POAL|nr:unnamed protein product [Miscanthus lutarioriparius]